MVDGASTPARRGGKRRRARFGNGRPALRGATRRGARGVRRGPSGAVPRAQPRADRRRRPGSASVARSTSSPAGSGAHLRSFAAPGSSGRGGSRSNRGELRRQAVLPVYWWLERREAAAHASSSAGDDRPMLSIIVPAYNEEQRLPATLVRMREYLDGRDEPYEVLVVDDGSSDGTLDTGAKDRRGLAADAGARARARTPARARPCASGC